MNRSTIGLVRAALVPILSFAVCTPAIAQLDVDLAALARAGELRVDTRQIVDLAEGTLRGAHVTAAQDEPALWLPDLEFTTGTIELEVRGKDISGQSFLGVAFGGVNDSTFEAVYLRPFNFRATDPARKAHAVQYISQPTHTWRRLRAEHPGVYEDSVDPTPDPDDWVRLRVVIEQARVQVFVGEGTEPDLVADRLGTGDGSRVGLWVGYNSEGSFASLRITPERP